MDRTSTPAWAIILAGGDGTRLQWLTRQVVGDTRPKQFCPLFGGETLLDCTRQRVDLLVRSDRQLVVVTRPHEAYYRYLAGELAPGRLVVQPHNRGTAPGIVYSLLQVACLAGDVPVAIFPSDHYVSDDRKFMSYASRALEVVRALPDIVVLLGIESSEAETEYGWIEPAKSRLPIDGEPVFPIRRFWEKPSALIAQRLLAREYLWNSFVMVGWLSTFLDLIEMTAPELSVAFEPVRLTLGSRKEGTAVDRVYAPLPAMCFSYRVLARQSGYLATLPVKGVEWSDWGNPRRVFACLHRMGSEPPWLAPLEAAAVG